MTVTEASWRIQEFVQEDRVQRVSTSRLRAMHFISCWGVESWVVFPLDMSMVLQGRYFTEDVTEAQRGQ